MKRKITQKLIDWKQAGAKKPLLIYGARQVGKSYTVNYFARKCYAGNFIEVNFQKNRRLNEIFALDLEPQKIIKSLEDLFGPDKKIKEGQTLVFFDEIQLCPAALTSLKYFAEDIEKGKSHYHIIGAGSLLGITFKLALGEDNRQNDVATHPVGKTEQIIAYPMDFEEFLWASGEAFLAKTIRECFENNRSVPEASHLLAHSLYQKFLVVGGMPEVVLAYLNRDNYRDIQKNILNDYENDINKYIKFKSDKQKILATYRSIPKQLGREKKSKRFTYTIIEEAAEGKKYRDSVLWLAQARIAIKCLKVKIGNAPLTMTEDEGFFKLYMSDTGLLCASLDITLENLPDYERKFLGVVAENYVACALQNKIKLLNRTLFYWKNGSRDESAEVDFLIATDDGNIPLEVKSGVNTASKSLDVFITKYDPKYSYRTSEKALAFDPKKSIRSVPLYAVFCIEEMI